MAGHLVRTDPQVRVSGELNSTGSLANFDALTISDETARALSKARPGQALNLAAGEIGMFKALHDAPTSAVQQRFKQMLLDRFHAYKASGLAGIAPYDRAGGTIADPAGELLKASNAAVYLQKYLPALQQELTVYPSPVVPGLEQNFHWLQYDIDGTPTFALMHEMAASAGAARAAVQRQYYVSTGYNAEQAIAGFLPVKSGTIVVYTNHTFTDRVAGFGGAAKRSIGRRVTSTKLEQIFAAARTKVSEPRRGQ